MKGVRDFYDRTARDWAERWYGDETMLPLLRQFVQLFQSAPRILDAGCGAGYESGRLDRLGADVVGIDFSDESISIARERNPGVRFEVMDCGKLDASLGSFDGITAIALIVHIPEYELPNVFAGFKSIINPCGYLFIAFMEGDGLSEERSFIEIDGVAYNRAFYMHCAESLNEAARSVGFEFREELFLQEDADVGQWRYFIYQAE